MKKPLPIPPMTPAQVGEMKEFFDACGKLPEPPPEKVRERMTILREMGLEDIPTYQGVSSSMRQYALTTLGAEMTGELNKDQPTVFMTLDASMLAKADELEKRFGIRPVHAFEMLAKMARENGQEAEAKKIEEALKRQRREQ